MELKRDEIGKRLEEFAASRFVLLKDFSNAIGIASSNLKTHYFTGKSLPGSEMIAKLMSLGCNVHWLFYGEYQNPFKEITIEDKVKNLENKINDLENENAVLRNSIVQIYNILKSAKKRRNSKKVVEVPVE